MSLLFFFFLQSIKLKISNLNRTLNVYQFLKKMFYSHKTDVHKWHAAVFCCCFFSPLFGTCEKKRRIFRQSSGRTPRGAGSPAVAPPLLVPLSVAVPLPHPLPLSVAPGAGALAVPLSLALTAAAHHGLRAPQEVVHAHVVVVLGRGKCRGEG